MINMCECPHLLQGNLDNDTTIDCHHVQPHFVWSRETNLVLFLFGSAMKGLQEKPFGSVHPYKISSRETWKDPSVH